MTDAPKHAGASEHADASVPDAPIPDAPIAGTDAAAPKAMSELHGLAHAAEARPKRPGVKRVLVADGARVVVFRFAAGQVLAEHKAAFPILVQSVDGHLQFTTGGRTADLRPGDLVHLPARILHEVHAVTDATLLLTMLDPDASADEA